MYDQIIEVIKFLMRVYDLFSDKQKDTAKTHVSDAFGDIFRKFYRKSSGEGGQA